MKKINSVLLVIVLSLHIEGYLFAQTDSLVNINNILLKVEHKTPLKYTEMCELLESYNVPQWKNNVELSEWRASAINSILLSPSNLNLLLEILSKNNEILWSVVSDILPVYETKNDSVYFYLHQQKGYDKIKEEIIKALKSGPQF